MTKKERAKAIRQSRALWDKIYSKILHIDRSELRRRRNNARN